MKVLLTDRKLKSLKPEGKPYELMDTAVPGFGIRVMGTETTAVRTFILLKRFPGSRNPTRRALGSYGELTLEQARDKAREWGRLIKAGIDPADAEKAAKEAEKKRKDTTFGAVLQDYLDRKASKLRSGSEIEREMKRNFKDWMDKPISGITPNDIKARINDIVNRGAATQAHTVFAMLRGFFNWVVESGDYGLEVSPCAKIKPNVLIGTRNVRSHILRDHETGAYWRAAEAMGYPFGPFFQLLALTALWRGEAADARWNEIDFDAGIWVIPAERMKGGAAHAVPLTPAIAELLKSLPRWEGGDFVFSTTAGRRPISGFSKAKARLDALMTADLEKQGKTFEDFIVHDIRRTCRTKFSALPVEDIVRELLLAHARPGLHRVYDLHAYEGEKAHALNLWHAKLKTIIEPKVENVIELKAMRG